MATDPDLTVATRTAIQEMAQYLSEIKHLTPKEAYQLMSVAGNVVMTQLVDKPNVGVHVTVPKSLFTGGK
jgi:acetamidase/formamidase